MPSKEIINRELAKLTIAYPYPERGDAELEILADMWAEDLEGMTDSEFVQRVKQYRKNSRWFPTSNDLLQVDLAAANPSEHKQLPRTPTQLSDAEVERNKKEAGKILEMLKHKKAM